MGQGTKPITHNLLPITYNLLPITYNLLPITYNLLPITYYLLNNWDRHISKIHPEGERQKLVKLLINLG